MIGDRKYDIIGAKKNGIDSLAVSCGYGAQKELEEAEPAYLCGNVLDIPGIVCG
jgi:phosphoglycolate phosphatase